MLTKINGELQKKRRLDSKNFHLGLTPRSNSVSHLLTNILQIYYEYLPTLANAFQGQAQRGRGHPTYVDLLKKVTGICDSWGSVHVHGGQEDLEKPQP